MLRRGEDSQYRWKSVEEGVIAARVFHLEFEGIVNHVNEDMALEAFLCLVHGRVRLLLSMLGENLYYIYIHRERSVSRITMN